MTLAKRETRQAVRLLGLLQDHLESAIESSLVPGTNQPMDTDGDAKINVAADRRDWWAAERLVAKLSGERPARVRKVNGRTVESLAGGAR